MRFHCFDAYIAAEYGILEAILLNFISIWIDGPDHVTAEDGRKWTRMSVRGFCSLMHYASHKSVSDALKHLEDGGLILVENLNDSKMDRTLWYTLTDLGSEVVGRWQNE